MKLIESTFLLILIFTSVHSFAQNSTLLGKIVNERNEPLAFSTIRVEKGRWLTSSNENGEFSIPILRTQDSIELSIQHVGMQTIGVLIRKRDFGKYQVFKLNRLSLTLPVVNITPSFKRTQNSLSSIFFDSETIQATQSFSLLDVLNNLPGKDNIAPDLNKVKPLTLRGGNDLTGGADNIFNLNNSLGIAIIVDDVYLSNNANMQSRSLSRWGMHLAGVPGMSYSDAYLGNQRSERFDVSYQGVDLREIPVNNIESIEVIQGVASAKYGDLTDGAIIITRQAGPTPWRLNLQLNGGSTSSSLNKGIPLGKKFGALNSSTTWTHSNADPRDKIKQFNRINQSLIWTKKYKATIKNTVSFDYHYRNDHRRLDPDDASQEVSEFFHRGYSISNRFFYSRPIKLIDAINFNINYSRSNQYSSRSFILNRGPIGVGFKDTIGIYKGYMSSGSYRGEEKILGVPINFSANLDISTSFDWESISHKLSFGLNYNFSNNGGKGIISDPARPSLVLFGSSNERAYDFEHLPASKNWGIYVENQFEGKVLDKDFHANLGVRADIQNSYPTIQPRVSTQINWSQYWSTSASFGLSSKAPTLAHLFPAPFYMDIELLKVYAGDMSKALYLIYTDKKILDNRHLRSAMSSQFEVGVQYKGKRFNSAFYAYLKNNWNGFETVNDAHRYTLPNFDYSVEEATGTITYREKSSTSDYFGFYGYQMTNGSKSTSYGFDWIINLTKIKSINTTFSLGNNLQVNSYSRTQPIRYPIEGTKIELSNKSILTYAVYSPERGNYLKIMSKLNSSTHIPKIGFIINFSADIFWKERRANTASIYPYAYYNSNGEYFEQKNDPVPPEILENLKLVPLDLVNEDLPFIYSIINMSLVKEIKRNFRININAYNLFNIRPEHSSVSRSGVEITRSYNRRPSFTFGTNINF